MKKLIFLLIIVPTALSVAAQKNKTIDYTRDKDMSSWVLDARILGASFSQQFTMANTSANYLNGINIRPGTLGFRCGASAGATVQLGYFFDRNKHWGVGMGLLYLRQWGVATLNDFHAEYQSVDNNGFVFRQVVSAQNIREEIKFDNFNIPLVLKYKNRFSQHWGFSADLGVLLQLQMKSKYSTNALFDYEAIYKFVNNQDGSKTPVYDNALVPDPTDFLITRSQFLKNNPSASVQDYFNTKRTEGYDVGLGVKAAQSNGATQYAASMLGFIVQPSIDYFLSDHVALSMGAFFMYQPFNNDGSATYTLTNKPGSYNAIVHAAEKIQTQAWGVHLGVRFFLGQCNKKMSITHSEQYSPTNCATCNGRLVVHGLDTGHLALLKYTVNGRATATPSVVDGQGVVQVSNLCAGTYTDVSASIKKRNAKLPSFNLLEPEITLGAVFFDHPSATGKCDGRIVIHGLPAGKEARLDYTLNAVTQTYSARVSDDSSFTLMGLCAAKYADLTITSMQCSVQIRQPNMIVLTNPLLDTIPLLENDSLQYVLFDFNESSIRAYSFKLIDEAYIQLKESEQLYLIIDGNTDRVGTDEYNQQLSERRANAVKAYLVAKGISTERIRIQANGERDPVATNQTASGRTQNRRAEMHLKLK
jgi:outer membrane protein OmpA-like peptidoglycan-associated protein